MSEILKQLSDKFEEYSPEEYIWYENLPNIMDEITDEEFDKLVEFSRCEMAYRIAKGEMNKEDFKYSIAYNSEGETEREKALFKSLRELYNSF